VMSDAFECPLEIKAILASARLTKVLRITSRRNMTRLRSKPTRYDGRKPRIAIDMHNPREVNARVT